MINQPERQQEFWGVNCVETAPLMLPKGSVTGDKMRAYSPAHPSVPGEHLEGWPGTRLGICRENISHDLFLPRAN